MNRTAWKIVGLACVLTLACTPGVRAQQPPQPGNTPAYQDPPAATGAQGQEREPRRPRWPGMRGKQEQEPRMPHWHGMRGNRGMRLQYFLARLTQQLKLSDVQRAQVQTLLHTHARDVIRLRAEIDTMALDVPPLLETEPVDLAKVKQVVQSIAAKRADLQMARITLIQDIRKLLTPEQQQQFRTMRSHMRGFRGMSRRDTPAQ
jgi:Spy/CpxP family protein refolding chaperone